MKLTRIINTSHSPVPEIQLLSNGRYHVMVTNAGAGYSRWKEIDLTRWREDGTCDNWGSFCYIYDLNSKTFWSNTHQPTLQKVDKYEAVFSSGRADFYCTNNNIETHTEMVVSSEDDVEIRRVSITNCSDSSRTIEVTSYGEVVIASASSDLQPAFSNLFVQTEILPSKNTILCYRRPLSSEEHLPWLFHSMIVHGKDTEEISYETDRMEFIGRGNTIVNPQAMNNAGRLSGNEGSVLDPVFAIRKKIRLQPADTVTIDLITGIAETRQICEGLINKYQEKTNRDSIFEVAIERSQYLLKQNNIAESDAQLYTQLASSLIFANASFRAAPSILIKNHLVQSSLWKYSISGDLPIALLRIKEHANIQIIKQLVEAHSFWRLQGISVDLLIVNEADMDKQIFQNKIHELIPPELKDKPGGIFLRASDQVSDEDLILFQTVARLNIPGNARTLTDYVTSRPVPKWPIPFITATPAYKPSLTQIPLPGGLIFFNGVGGFSPDASEYIIIVAAKNKTPLPWVNVIANPNFGTVISESGTAYTWAENAHEFRLTPWNNDPVCDLGGEVIYLRDEESGHFWSATPLPAGGQSAYVTRHGFGYSFFEHIEDGVYSEMCVYVDIDSTIKFIVLKVRNQSGRSRKLSATGYIEWVLGNSRTKTGMYIHTEVDPGSGAFFAKNPYNTEFSQRVAFFDVDCLKKTFTGDRNEFIGRDGTLKNPDAMSRIQFSGRTGSAMDPCAAIRVPLDLANGKEQEIIFRLGAGKDSKEASAIARQFRGSIVAHESFQKVKNYWKHNIGALHVETPDAAINIITNGWLTYQTLSCRLWGRSGFYQSGGAFGFRDQLQDVLSLLYAVPLLAREHILLSASRQFKEGDVQHWWHPPAGRGVRTRCSDDFLWLPFVTSEYISHTGDRAILDEMVFFLDGRLLNAGEESYYELPLISTESAKLYDHCVRAIKHAFNYGVHDLPLIGTGDWNDGYNKVGNNGKGESVWLAFFLYDILSRFCEIAQMHNDPAFADECKKEARQLKENIDKHAWDGSWYKRAWFDNGTPLGSSVNEECKIDSIAQSWSVISGAGDDKRVKPAMEVAYKNLVQKNDRIIKLLEPAFDKSGLNPGYIKGYVPGVRENGGQYTHAAVWMIIAFARLGDNKRVWELLNIINPINHGKTSETIAIYKAEPYVLAADVYSHTPHAGRGGWTWYTGSAGWLYGLVIEFFLGFQLTGNKLKFVPCIPKEWESFKIDYRYKNTNYHIVVNQKSSPGKIVITVDGVEQEDKIITLTDDGMEHNVRVSV